MKKILITGGSGFLGWNITPPLQEYGYIVTGASSAPRIYHQKPERPQFIYLDIALENTVLAAIEHIRPDVIIHAAAISSPLYAEQHPEQTYKINTEGTALLLYLAEKFAIPIVFISTDLVFNGMQGNYTELDTPNATITYGQSKAQAEQLFVQSSFTDWIVLRTSLMYGYLPTWIQRFPQQAVEQVRQGEQVVLFNDQFRTPIFAPDIAHYLHGLFRENIWGEIFHCGGPEKISRSDMVLRYFRSCGVTPSTVISCSMDEVQSYSTTVRDVSLNSEKLQKIVDIEPMQLLENYSKLVEQQRHNWI